MKAQKTNVTEKRCWAITEVEEDHDATGNVPVIWSLNLTWTTRFDSIYNQKNVAQKNNCA
jgi:hypothetical protein